MYVYLDVGVCISVYIHVCRYTCASIHMLIDVVLCFYMCLCENILRTE